MAERSQDRTQITAVCCYRLWPELLCRGGCRLGVAGCVVLAGCGGAQASTETAG